VTVFERQILRPFTTFREIRDFAVGYPTHCRNTCASRLTYEMSRWLPTRADWPRSLFRCEVAKNEHFLRTREDHPNGTQDARQDAPVETTTSRARRTDGTP